MPCFWPYFWGTCGKRFDGIFDFFSHRIEASRGSSKPFGGPSHLRNVQESSILKSSKSFLRLTFPSSTPVLSVPDFWLERKTVTKNRFRRRIFLMFECLVRIHQPQPGNRKWQPTKSGCAEIRRFTVISDVKGIYAWKNRGVENERYRRIKRVSRLFLIAMPKVTLALRQK